jgi:hypothetical protein
MHALELPRELVMISGYVGDAGTLARLSQYLLHHIIVRLRPVPAAAQPPAIDNIADQIDIVRIVMTQKVYQKLGLRGFRAQMKVRNENRAETTRLLTRHWQSHLSCDRYASIHATNM